MTPELTVYMLPSRHCALSTSLYGEEHGSGERILSLDMVSGQDNLNIQFASPLPIHPRQLPNTQYRDQQERVDVVV
jgi:hypothetical protein